MVKQKIFWSNESDAVCVENIKPELNREAENNLIKLK